MPVVGRSRPWPTRSRVARRPRPACPATPARRRTIDTPSAHHAAAATAPPTRARSTTTRSVSCRPRPRPPPSAGRCPAAASRSRCRPPAGGSSPTGTAARRRPTAAGRSRRRARDHACIRSGACGPHTAASPPRGSLALARAGGRSLDGSGVDDDEGVVGPVERVGPGVGGHHDVLEPEARTAREVDAGLDVKAWPGASGMALPATM